MDRPFWTGLAVGVLLAFKTWGCPNAAQAEAVLRAEGYAEVRPAGAWAGWSCGRGDLAATPFAATSPGGARVRGVVCCGPRTCAVRVGDGR